MDKKSCLGQLSIHLAVLLLAVAAYGAHQSEVIKATPFNSPSNGQSPSKTRGGNCRQWVVIRL